VLSSTNLSDARFQVLAENMPRNLRTIDVSRNPNLTLKSYRVLADTVSKVKAFNFEGNAMGDEACQVVCDMVIKLSTVTSLNLSKCSITDTGASHLACLISSSNTLRVLLLHWNKIRSKGACSLAKAMRSTHSLQIFDSSFNAFGSNRVAAKKWAKTFKVNVSLIHVDLSFNQFKVDDIRLLGEGLKLNHRILGIHLMGNEASVDELGFVTPEKTLDQASLHVFTRIPGKDTRSHERR